jgi:hypothetical protein
MQQFANCGQRGSWHGLEKRQFANLGIECMYLSLPSTEIQKNSLCFWPRQRHFFYQSALCYASVEPISPGTQPRDLTTMQSAEQRPNCKVRLSSPKFAKCQKHPHCTVCWIDNQLILEISLVVSIEATDDCGNSQTGRMAAGTYWQKFTNCASMTDIRHFFYQSALCYASVEPISPGKQLRYLTTMRSAEQRPNCIVRLSSPKFTKCQKRPHCTVCWINNQLILEILLVVSIETTDDCGSSQTCRSTISVGTAAGTYWRKFANCASMTDIRFLHSIGLWC